MRSVRPALRLTLSWFVLFGLALGGCRALIGTTPFELVGDGGSTSSSQGTSSSQNTSVATDGSASTGSSPDAAAGDASTADVATADAITGSSDAPSEVGDAREDATSSNDAAPDVTVSGDGGITLVQANATGPLGILTSVSVDFDVPVTAHDAIVVALSYDSVSPPQISDTLQSNFQPAISVYQDAGSAAPGIDAIWYALDVGGGTDRVTVTVSTATQSYFEVFVQEYAGLAALDGTASQSGVVAASATAMQTGSVTTTKAGDLIFALGVDGTVSPGTGFAVATSSNADITEGLIAGAPGPYQATATASFGGWCLSMAAFRGF